MFCCGPNRGIPLQYLVPVLGDVRDRTFLGARTDVRVYLGTPPGAWVPWNQGNQLVEPTC